MILLAGLRGPSGLRNICLFRMPAGGSGPLGSRKISLLVFVPAKLAQIQAKKRIDGRSPNVDIEQSHDKMRIFWTDWTGCAGWIARYLHGNVHLLRNGYGMAIGEIISVKNKQKGDWGPYKRHQAQHGGCNVLGAAPQTPFSGACGPAPPPRATLQPPC